MIQPLLRDYDAEDVKRVMATLLRYGEFGSTQEAARRNASICAHEVLAILTTAPAPQSDRPQ